MGLLQPADEYGSPSLDEIAVFSQQFSDEFYKAIGERADDIAVEVSSPVSACALCLRIVLALLGSRVTLLWLLRGSTSASNLGILRPQLHETSLMRQHISTAAGPWFKGSCSRGLCFFALFLAAADGCLLCLVASSLLCTASAAVLIWHNCGGLGQLMLECPEVVSQGSGCAGSRAADSHSSGAAALQASPNACDIPARWC